MAKTTKTEREKRDNSIAFSDMPQKDLVKIDVFPVALEVSS